MKSKVATIDLIRLLGSPFVTEKAACPSDEFLLHIYDQAFEDRVAPLYLHQFRRAGWDKQLEAHYLRLRDRENMTFTVLTDLAGHLNRLNPEGYVVMKSIKPYPAIPNDTDILIFGGKSDFSNTLEYLYGLGYMFHEWAPMQTTLYDSRGVGKIGRGKKGGTYYIDVYQNISTDYVCYLDKRSVLPYTYMGTVRGLDVRLLRAEPELAIILFHNVFPERTYQLEHFYMPLYYLVNPDFDRTTFIGFVEENYMQFAVKTNLSLIETLHRECFGFVPDIISGLLDHWGRNASEIERFRAGQMQTPHMFSIDTFSRTFMLKLRDRTFLSSLFVQSLHMLNPVFFVDVMRSLKKRFSERGTYHLE